MSCLVCLNVCCRVHVRYTLVLIQVWKQLANFGQNECDCYFQWMRFSLKKRDNFTIRFL